MTGLWLADACPQDASATSSKKQQQAALGLQRASVVNWMVEMGYCLYQSNDVLHLAVMCYDRCCRAAIAPAITACKQHPTASSSSSVDSRPPPVQLVALACLWVAAKYQSVKAPPAGTLLQVMPGSGYVTSDLAAAERWVLAKLGYSLGSGGPTIKEQLHAILEEHTSLALPLPQQLYPLTSYIAELALLEAALLDTPSGLVAAAAYWYASALLGCPLGDAALQRVTSFGLHQVKPVGTWLSAVHATVTQAAAAGSPYSSTSKYLLPEYKEVAAVGTALLLRGAPLA
jgi:hypothetical protein